MFSDETPDMPVIRLNTKAESTLPPQPPKSACEHMAEVLTTIKLKREFAD